MLVNGVREHVNSITAWIDASAVYGSDDTRAAELRDLNSKGKLKSQFKEGHELLPYNEAGLPNAGQAEGDEPSDLFLAGDIRANEQAGLISMHTLFVREHNRLAALAASAWPGKFNDEIYHLARKIVAAEIQRITYHEFLPALLGEFPAYSGHDSSVDGGIFTEFSTAAYRFGHSLLPSVLALADGTDVLGGILLQDTFFDPKPVFDPDHGGDPALVNQLLHGFVVTPSQPMDEQLNNSVRNFLFGDPGEGGTDLAALNIQRGRDHGIAGCNAVRQAVGLGPFNNLGDLTTNQDVQQKLAAVYGENPFANGGDIDLWPCGLAEDLDPDSGSQLGPTFTKIIELQFINLRDGDSVYYEGDDMVMTDQNVLDIIDVKTITLADIIEFNTGIRPATDNVFQIVGSDGMLSSSTANEPIRRE